MDELQAAQWLLDRCSQGSEKPRGTKVSVDVICRCDMHLTQYWAFVHFDGRSYDGFGSTAEDAARACLDHYLRG